MALYDGLLRGLNLVQQKSWDESELKKYFPEYEAVWSSYLVARHPPGKVLDERYRALELLRTWLEDWNDPIEATILKKRLHMIEGYFAEVAKPFCDENSLNFFLQDFPLLSADLDCDLHDFTSSGTNLSAREAQKVLTANLHELFPQNLPKVVLSKGTLARASTMKMGLRLREDVTYSLEELSLLTVHEAWVHLGSNLSGVLQKDLPWLAQWHPGVTGLQEGLALIAEIITGHWQHGREAQVILRHQAGILALRGDHARKVWQFLCDHGFEEKRAIEVVLRIFRGCHLDGGLAFGKEFQYLLGLHQWLIRKDQVLPEDMRIALSGKMDFLEWEMLKGPGLGEKIKKPNPPAPLLQWMNHPSINELAKRLRFYRAA